MSSEVTWLEPPFELPDRFPSPFDAELEPGPHPLARRAAEILQKELGEGTLDCSRDGKMVGVLVVSDELGRVGFLRAFSGTYQGRWDVPGFVEPLFHRRARETIEPEAERVLAELNRRVVPVPENPSGRHAQERAEMVERHRVRKEARAHARTEANLEALAQESRGDKSEKRWMDARHAEEMGPFRRAERRARALVRLRRFISRRFMRAIHDCYLIPNARGEHQPLRALFTPREPPSGAGDCVAPKLLAATYSRGLKPLAMAELWCGPPPPAGGRLEGEYYPACQEKCGPVLPFMLGGIDVAERRRFVPSRQRSERLRILFEDELLIVVEKPAGLLSVPGKGAALLDSVETRLRDQAGEAFLVHRLDLDTSGILLAARDLRTFSALQAQFARREVEKRYLAWVSRVIAEAAGEIALPLRVDIHDRPRQIVDPVHGKKAVTRWQVLARTEDRTRVALVPVTGRTHQLRVHCAHPEGLRAAIVGDRLYGRSGARLLLHAEALTVTHPATGARVQFLSPAPF